MIFTILVLICILLTCIRSAIKDKLGQLIFMITGIQTSFSFFSLFTGDYWELLYLLITMIIVGVYSYLRRKELNFRFLFTQYFIFLLFSALLSGVVYLIYFA